MNKKTTSLSLALTAATLSLSNIARASDLSNNYDADKCTKLGSLCPNEPSLDSLLSNIANWMVGLFGALFVLMIVIAGAQMASAGDSPERLKAAKSRLINAIIGLTLLLSFRAILALVGITVN
jgi:hypothetical protein